MARDEHTLLALTLGWSAAAGAARTGHRPGKEPPPAPAPGTGGVPVAGTYPNVLEVGDALAEAHNEAQREMLCGDTGPACPAMRAPRSAASPARAARRTRAAPS